MIFRLQTKMRQLEQEAHKAAGQVFLLTSSTQLRTVWIFLCADITFLVWLVWGLRCFIILGYLGNFNLCLQVLFEKLCLHERCDNKKLPKTINKQQSTSEAAV